ncbi:ketoacyl-ACP synthase III [Nitrospira defluvii]|nr:ketoacyl-ACP synthase III [Nitrospira defluvii]
MVSTIIGTGRALPKRLVTNRELSKRLGIREEEIERKTGILTRYWVESDETTSTLAIQAAKRAIASADLTSDQIDLILVTTTFPDMYFPSTACLVQKGLSARPVPAYDINGSCTGFLYGLSIADQYLQNDSVKRVLVISAEVKSRSIDLSDPSTAILFGDGAGAVVLSRGNRGIRKIKIGADGSRHRLISLPGGGSRHPLSGVVLEAHLHYIKMAGKELFRTAVKTMDTALNAFLEAASFSLEQIDYFIFHQANLRILEALFRRKGIPLHKTQITLRQFGNTSSSSLPIALDVAVEEGRIKSGDTLLLSAFGGGITWGNVLLDWDTSPENASRS